MNEANLELDKELTTTPEDILDASFKTEEVQKGPRNVGTISHLNLYSLLN